MAALVYFAVLQGLDVVTTLVVLGMGGFEANPLVKLFMQAGPALGLILSKLLVFCVVGVILWLKRPRAIRLANYVYTTVIIWNAANIAAAISVAP